MALNWAYDLSGADGPLVRDCPLYDASDIIRGQALTYGATTRGGVLIDAAETAADFVGVAQETITASTTALTTGTIVYGKVCLSPNAVYRVNYDLTASTDIDVVSSTSTATTLGTCDDDLEGSWLYCNTGTGAGQLGYIGAASTTVMTLDTTTAWTTTPDSTTDCVIIRKPWRYAANSGNDLNSTFDAMLSDEDETGEIIILEHFIRSRTIALEQLRPRRHHMLQNLNNDGVEFYVDVLFADAVLRGATTMA